MADWCCAGQQPNRGPRCKFDCGSCERTQQLAAAGPCESNFERFVTSVFCVRAEILCCVGEQPNRGRRRNVDCRRCGKTRQLADTEPCEMNFEIFVQLNSRILYLSRFIRTDMCCVERQQNRRQWRKEDCRSCGKKQQLADPKPCEINFLDLCSC
jgi:hypothetical protein